LLGLCELVCDVDCDWLGVSDWLADCDWVRVPVPLAVPDWLAVADSLGV